MFASDDRHRYLPRYSSWCLLAATISRAIRTVDVVIASHAGLDAVNLVKVPAQTLAEQFFPTIAVFGICRIGVGLL
jgi:hypothetical protein